MTEKIRQNAAAIDAVESKKGVKGQFLRIQVQGSWYSCFEKLNPEPHVGEMWGFNIKQAGDFENLIDMIRVEGQQPAPQTQEPVQMPAGATLTGREMRITTLACIKAAADCCHIDLATEETIKVGANKVLMVADIFIDRVTR